MQLGVVDHRLKTTGFARLDGRASLALLVQRGRYFLEYERQEVAIRPEFFFDSIDLW